MTKQLFFLTTILLFVSVTWAQPYRSVFGKTSTSWTSTREAPDLLTSDSVFTTSDTLMGGNKYKIVKGFYFGKNSFIREDTATGKVWFYSKKYPYAKDTECLIMNLNLLVGDSFGFTFLSYYAQSYFVIVDSVYFVTGRKYIRFNYNLGLGIGEERKFTFIEGIGSTAGILFQHYSWNPFLLCKFMDGQKEYSNNFFKGSCRVDIGLGIEQKASNQSLDIFPNPFSSVLNISSYEIFHEKTNIRILNILGETVYSSTFENINDKNISLDNLNLNPGIYFIRINGDTFRISKKVICSK